MKLRHLIILIGIMIIFIGLGIVLKYNTSQGLKYKAINGPIIMRYKDSAAVDPGDGLFVIFNPIRDKSSEIVAEALLTSLKKGNCQQIREIYLDEKYKEHSEHICDREAKYKLVDWYLVDREDEFSHCRLHFKAQRVSYSNGTYGNVWVSLIQENNKWVITDYESWY